MQEESSLSDDNWNDYSEDEDEVREVVKQTDKLVIQSDV
jgi:hypothetical protein